MGQPEEWRIPLPVSHLYKDSSMLADMALFGGSASVGSQKPNYCGLQRISRSFEKQTSLHPDCGFACSGSQSVWALVRDHFGCWKNHSLILTFGCQSHHTCGLWMTLVCRMTGEEGNVVWGSQQPFHQEWGRETLPRSFDTTCAHSIVICVSQKCPPCPALTFPLDPLKFDLESSHLEHCKAPYSQ